MARAKRTSRAEARRRYRAQLAENAAAQEDTEDDAPAEAQPSRAAGRTRGDSGSPATRSATPPQSGFRYAFRAAYHPVNLRDDLAHLPDLLRSRAVLVPAAITIATAITIAATSGSELFSRLLAQYFLVPPPIGSIFIAGFFAKRASYLAGFIVGLIAALALTALITLLPALSGGTQGLTGAATPTPTASVVASASPAPSPSASTAASASSAASPSASAASSASASAAPSTTPSASPTPSPTPVDTLQVAGYALIMSPLTGIFFASAAAWYRRFLQLSNANRARTPPRGNRNRPNNRRR